MKKNTKNTKTKDDGLKDVIDAIKHMYRHCSEEMDRLELRGFITKNNNPKLDELDEDDRIGVHHCIAIGAYLVAARLQHEVSDIISESLFDGKVTIAEIAPEDMPEDVAEALQKLVNMVKKVRKENK